MYQFGRRSIYNSNLNLSPLTKYQKQNDFLEQKQSNSPIKEQDQTQNNNESILNRIKRRTFSLSKLQSVQQSQIAKSITTLNKIEEQKKSISDRLVFQKLIFNSASVQEKNKSPKTYRRRNEKNPFFTANSQAEEQIILLKQILRKKQDDLILNKRQSIGQNDSKQQNQLRDLNRNNQNTAIKRIKLFKKTKQYEFYDNLVHTLLTNINKDQLQIGCRYDDQDDSTNQNRNIKSQSFGNIKTNDKQKYRNTFTNNFSSTKSTAMSNLGNTNKGGSGLLQKKKQTMIFRLSDLTCDNVYEKKITTFVQFLYKINFSNSIYVDLSLSSSSTQKNQLRKTFKVYVGYGNNSGLIKSIVKRRFWLEITSNKSQCNFIWTQDTQKDAHLKQLQESSCKGQEQVTEEDEPNRRSSFTLKHKFTHSSYNQQNNLKILHPKQLQQANASYSRSYVGLKSPYPQVSFKTITNHIPNNSIIGSKKILFKLMHWYYLQMQKIDPFKFLPHTYHIVPGEKDNMGIKKFKQDQSDKKQRIWIVKPGENTNRGNGISVASTKEIQTLMRHKKFHKNGELKTYIVQKYLKPFLYNSRKFDLRHYLLITSVNGIIKGYWYDAGYIRTSSQKFDLDDLDNEFIHLTNDAIQKNSQNYGKYEEGNKISYSSFQRYLDNTVPHKKYDFEKQILSEMKKITTDVLRGGFMFLDPDRNQRLLKGKGSNFQLYGMDFMIDHKFKPYLIEINANPCLQISCPLLESLIPIAIEHTFRLALDPLMPPNDHYAPSKRYQLCDRILERLKFSLIFDQKNQGKQLRKRYKNCENKFELNGMALEPEQDLFEDDGNQISDDKLFQQAKL